MSTARVLALGFAPLGLALLGLASACHRESATVPRASPTSAPREAEPHARPGPAAEAAAAPTAASSRPDPAPRERTEPAPDLAAARDDAPPIAPAHADDPSRSAAAPSRTVPSDQGDAGGGDTKTCCRVCRKGKACGDTCVSQDRNCTAGPGCACNG